jgi:nicotinate-nucleotide pyrophosphorylase (carboxylating)
VSADTLDALEAASYRDVVRRALAEDLGWGDITTNAVVAPSARAVGVLFTRGPCVLAGLEIAGETFRQLDPSAEVTRLRQDGERCQAGERVGEVRGLASALLTGERTALNFLRHLSGIATLTRAWVEAAGGGVTIADTRKTLPLLRALEKHAVRLGGGENGRATLDDGVVIKANHVRLAGGIRPAIERLREAARDTPIEIEVASLGQVDEALAAGATVVLASRFSLDEVRETLRRCSGRARVEISGAVTLDRLPGLVAAGATYISLGDLTDSAAAADISLELELQ